MSNGFDFDLEGFDQDLQRSLENSGQAFRGKYADELAELMGLSKDEIDSITPGPLDLQKYDELITVVKEASRVNLNQAQLKSRIEQLGEVAVSIAKRIPKFSAFLA